MRMRLALATLGCSLMIGCAHDAPSPKQELAGWKESHPEAAQELCAWSRQHPRASDQLLLWESNNGPRALELQQWAAANPGYGWESFLSQHQEWQDFAGIASQHPRAVNQMVDWGRRHPRAAQELLEHQGAMRFAGKRNAC
jgi:hypothetical protein